MILEKRVPRIEAFKFEGGFDAALQVISWLHERHIKATYSPEIGEDGRIVLHEHIVVEISAHRHGGRFTVGKGEWVVDDPESTLYSVDERTLFEQYKVASGD